MADREELIMRLMIKIVFDPRLMKKFKENPRKVLKDNGIIVEEGELDQAGKIASDLTRYPFSPIILPKSEQPSLGSGSNQVTVGPNPNPKLEWLIS